MPTPTGMMDAKDIDRLRQWHHAIAEADYCERLFEIEEAIAGIDLYDRPLTDMNDNQCDYHTATVFRVPVNEVRRKRKSLRYKVVKWLRLL